LLIIIIIIDLIISIIVRCLVTVHVWVVAAWLIITSVVFLSFYLIS
jgi:hypothetical protein